MTYYCFRCGKDFLHKGHLNRHFKKRKLCESKYLDVSYNEIEENYEYLLECFNILKPCTRHVPENVPEMYPKCTQNVPEMYEKNEKKVYKCKFCNKIYKYHSGLYRHMKHRCKKNPINHQKIINITNNIQNTQNNIQNTQNNTIIINSYGKEDISYLKSEQFLNLLKGPFSSIQKTNNAIHFNEKHPENMNIMITNKKEPYAKIYKNNKWCLIEKKTIIQDMIEKAFDLIDTYYDNEGKFELNKRKDKVYKRFLNYYDNDPNFMRRIEKEIELMIINKGIINCVN